MTPGSAWFRSVRGIATLYGIAFAIVTAGFGMAVYLATQSALQHQVDQRLASEAGIVAGSPPTASLAAIARQIVAREGRRSTSDIGYLLIDSAGRHVAGKLSMRVPPDGYSNVSFRDGVEGIDRGRALSTRLANGARLILVADSEPVEAFDELLVRIFAIAFGAAIVTGVIGGLALSATIGGRIKGINRAAEAIIGGDLHQRMPIDGSGGEFDRQSATLNRMLDRIEELMGNLKQVSGDIAHDLRTPLARLRNRLEYALSPSLDLDMVRVEVGEGLVQIEEVLELFAALLRISEIEAGDRRAGFRELRLDVLARDVAETFAPAIEDEGRSLIFDVMDAVTLRGDKDLLTQLIVNLLENAAHHTPAGTSISIGLTGTSHNATLTVADDGPGAGDADQTALMRRFSRLEASRSTPGHGLGLALVDAVARLHDGTVILSNGNPGFVVSVSMPTSPKA